MTEAGDRTVCHTHAVVTQNYGNVVEVIFLYIRCIFCLNFGKMSVLLRLFIVLVLLLLLLLLLLCVVFVTSIKLPRSAD